MRFRTLAALLLLPLLLLSGCAQKETSSAQNNTVGDMTIALDTLGEKLGLKIHVMHEDVFNSMHRI